MDITKPQQLEERLAKIEKRLAALEKDSHPMKELDEFEVWPELDGRIKKLEEKMGE